MCMGAGGPFAVVSPEQRISNLEWHYFCASLYTEEVRKAAEAKSGDVWERGTLFAVVSSAPIVRAESRQLD